MYLPPKFEQQDEAILRALIANFPLATLITIAADGLTANHIPLFLIPGSGEHGTLIGHVARNNDLWREGRHIGESLAVFQGVDAYISPNWYATKQETHEVVPTWNYAIVHAYGELVIHDDEKWVRGAVGRLTKKLEDSRQVPWKMADAPSEFISSQLSNIIGIEMPISRLVGKWKVSQNRGYSDRVGAIEGLRATGGANNSAMADLIESTSGER